jgi:hypothetical protein
MKHDSLELSLDKPIAFHRVFVEITGSVSAALMMSQAMYWHLRTNESGWFYKTAKEWQEETGLTRRKQELARAKLRKAGLIEERLSGTPAKLYFRVVKSRLHESVNQVSTKGENLISPFVKTITETTSEEHHKNDGAASPESSSDSKPLSLKPEPPNPPVTGNMDSQNENTSMDASVSQDFEGGGSRDASDGDRGGTGQPRFNPGPFFVAWKEKSGVRDGNGILRGGDMPRSWLKTLKGVVTEFGQECALDAWKNYLNLNQLQFNPTAFKFARTIVEWIVAEKPKDSGLTPDGYEWRK